MAEIVMTNGEAVLVDDEDFVFLSSMRWNPLHLKRTTYARTRTGGPHVYMHRLLIKVGHGFEVDHINGNGLDNRKANLRPCTKAQNQANSRRLYGKSKYKGVMSRGDQWCAVLCQTVQGKRKRTWLGKFVKEEDAARAYNRAAKEAFGEYARLNPVAC